MNPHDAILAMRDCKLHEWPIEKLKDAHAACCIELTRLEQLSKLEKQNYLFRITELAHALIAIRTAIQASLDATANEQRHTAVIEQGKSTLSWAKISAWAGIISAGIGLAPIWWTGGG